MEDGQKRKAMDDSSRGKGKKKKGESSSDLALEHNPLYFPDDRDQERYNLDCSLKKVLNGHWINHDFFDSYNFEYSSKKG